MFFNNYAEFTVTVPHSAEFIEKRLQKRCLSWKSWRNYFYSPDDRIDFKFSRQNDFVVLYPVCGSRNSMRGEFFLEFEPVSGGKTLIHVTVKAPSAVILFMFIWFTFTGIFAILSLLSGAWHIAVGGTIMLIFGIFLLFFMRKSAENELDNTIAAFRDIVSDDYNTARYFTI